MPSKRESSKNIFLNEYYCDMPNFPWTEKPEYHMKVKRNSIDKKLYMVCVERKEDDGVRWNFIFERDISKNEVDILRHKTFSCKIDNQVAVFYSVGE